MTQVSLPGQVVNVKKNVSIGSRLWSQISIRLAPAESGASLGEPPYGFALVQLVIPQNDTFVAPAVGDAMSVVIG